jgi:hypothetical protein
MPIAPRDPWFTAQNTYRPLGEKAAAPTGPPRSLPCGDIADGILHGRFPGIAPYVGNGIEPGIGPGIAPGIDPSIELDVDLRVLLGLDLGIGAAIDPGNAPGIDPTLTPGIVPRGIALV